MAKKRMIAIAAEMNTDLEELRRFVFEYLDEGMISGKGDAVWIDENGQALIDDNFPAPYIGRGVVMGSCPNKRYVWVKYREKHKRIAVRIPKRLVSRLNNKYIYFKESIVGNEFKYEYVPNSIANPPNMSN